MKEKVINIAKEVFQNDVNENSKICDFDSWDSLGQLNLFMALESELDVKFSHEEIIDSDSVEKIVTLIESKK
jgi:acyl carrier protein